MHRDWARTDVFQRRVSQHNAASGESHQQSGSHGVMTTTHQGRSCVGMGRYGQHGRGVSVVEERTGEHCRQGVSHVAAVADGLC